MLFGMKLSSRHPSVLFGKCCLCTDNSIMDSTWSFKSCDFFKVERFHWLDRQHWMESKDQQERHLPKGGFLSQLLSDCWSPFGFRILYVYIYNVIYIYIRNANIFIDFY